MTCVVLGSCTGTHPEFRSVGLPKGRMQLLQLVNIKLQFRSHKIYFCNQQTTLNSGCVRVKISYFPSCRSSAQLQNQVLGCSNLRHHCKGGMSGTQRAGLMLLFSGLDKVSLLYVSTWEIKTRCKRFNEIWETFFKYFSRKIDFKPVWLCCSSGLLLSTGLGHGWHSCFANSKMVFGFPGLLHPICSW